MNTRTDENAIQSDATTQQENKNSGAENEESAVHTPSARESAMEAIAAQRRQSLADDGVDIDTEWAGETALTQDDTQLAAQLGQDERPTMATDTMRVKVKVDGEEIDLPLSEVVKSYQKDAAASKRLQEATRLLQIAEQQASKLAQNENQENNSPGQQVDPQDKEARRGKIKDAFTKLYEGDEDGAVEAMLQIVGESGAPAATQQAPVIDTQAIAAQVRQQLDVESAYSETRLDYPELFSDTERGVVLGKETLARMSAKESLGIPRAQAMHESAAEVAALFGIQKSGRQTNEKQRTARDTKLERKASLDIPDSANVVAGNKQSPAEAQNVSSVIAEMAKSRLGQSLNAR